MIERAELCVHRNSTLKAGVMPLSSWGAGGSRLSDVAAQFGPAAAAGLGQEGEQLPQAREAHGMDDLAALAGGLGQARALECGEMEREWSRRACRAAPRCRRPAGRWRPLRSAGASGPAGFPATVRRRRRLPPMFPYFQFDGNNDGGQVHWWPSPWISAMGGPPRILSRTTVIDPRRAPRDPINQSLKPTFNQIEPRSLHPPDHQPGQVLPGSKSGSIIFRSETEQVSVTADRRAYAG